MKVKKLSYRLLILSTLAGAFQTSTARAQSGAWTNLAGGSWATAANWAGGTIATGSGNTANFSTLTLGAAPTVTLDGARTIGNLIFGDLGNTYGWSLNTGSAGPLTLAGTPVITVNGQTTTIGAVLAGAGFTKNGPGTLNLTAAETYIGTTTINAGAVDISGTSSGGSTGSSLEVGGATGNGVLNFSTTGSWSWSVSSGELWVGGNGSTTDTGAGALNQSAGTINFGSGYVTLGEVGPAAYGSYVLSGGTLNVENTEGVRVGYGGMGSWVQTGGILDCPRYFSIGGDVATGDGVATFLGGVANVGTGGFRFLVPDAGGATAVLNVGTEAGGAATIIHPYSVGLYMEASAGGVGTINLDSGVLQLGGPIFRNNSTGGSATANLDGATLQAGGNVTLINNTLSSVNVFNNGIVFDSSTNAYAATVSADLLAASGSGIYPTNGFLPITSGGGSGYIGSPLVTVTGGSGFGAMAVGAVTNGVLTGVTLTCPGQNYLAGDTLSFVFTGGGPATAANTFSYTLKPGDVAVNTTGGVKVIGTGSVTLSSPNTYLGNTIVARGALYATVDGALGYGSVIVSNGASLNLSGGNTNGYISSVASLILGTNATANLDYSGTDPIVGLSTNGGKNYVAPGLWGAVGSGATYTSSLLSGSGFLQVTVASNGTPVEISSYTPAQNVYARHSAVFSVKLGLGTAPTYQWQYSDGETFTNDVANGATGTGSFIAGATTSTLTVSNVSSADAAYYYTCFITNGLPSAASSPLAPLTLLVSTNGLVTRPGDPITDFYSAIGTPDPYPSGTPAADIIDGTLAPYLNYGANGAGYSFTGPVGFVVTPSIGSSLVTGARIYTSANPQADDPADFSLYGSDDGTNWTFIDYSLLSLPLARNASGGTINSNNEVLQEIDFHNTTGYYLYAVFFTNTVSGSAVAGLDFAEVQLLGAPTNIAPGIVSEPAPAVEYRLAGGSASFSLVAHGAGTLAYQWYEGSTSDPLVGATNASYTLTNLTTSLTGVDFFCVVSNSYGSITSSSVTVIVQAPTPSQATILAFNPVAYWPLNETGGTTAYDYAGNHNGTYIGGFTLDQAGPPSTAGYGAASASVSFDGSSGYVDIPEGNLNFTGPITLIQYIQTTSANFAFETTLGHGDSSYRLDVAPEDGYNAHFADQSPDIQGTTALDDGNWHQLVGVYDGTNGYIYVDGQLQNSGVENHPSGSSYDVLIAAAPDYLGSRNFLGNIAEVAIITNALSAAQVAQLYTPPNSVGASGYLSPLFAEAYAGAPVTYSANGVGSPPLYYQWYVDGVPVSSATNATFTYAAECGWHTNEVSISNSFNGGSIVFSSPAILVGDAYPTNVTFNSDGAGWQLNTDGAGSVPTIADNVLELTDGSGDESSSAFYAVGQYVGDFTASFTYTAGGNAQADGAAFILEDSAGATNALGVLGGGLGYFGITNSLALEINLYNDFGITAATNGETQSDGGHSYEPTGPVDVNSGDPINFALNFASGVLAVTLTDETTLEVYSTNYILGATLNGANLAYVGFSGGTGTDTSIQTISDFQFTPIIPPVALSLSPITAGTFKITWPVSPAGYDLETTTNLAAPWVAGPAPTVVSGVNQVTVPTGNGTKFFRLQREVCQ